MIVLLAFHQIIVGYQILNKEYFLTDYTLIATYSFCFNLMTTLNYLG